MKTITIGKNATNDFVVNDDTVSRQHAVLTVSDSGEVTIKDLNSLNGTFVDGKRITGPTILLPNQVVRVGDTTLDWQKIIAEPKTVISKTFRPSDAVEVRRLGKEADNDICFANPEVSRYHALLCKKKNGRASIVDCDSTNGTFVNGQRISGEKVLQHGDKVMIANKYPFEWEIVFPQSGSKKKMWLAVAGIAAAVAIVVVLWSYFGKGKDKTKEVVEVKEEKPLQPSEIYAMYKNSVVLILQKNCFYVTANGEYYGKYITDGNRVRNGEGSFSGSGFFISDDGKIMTNRHVVAYTEKEKELVKKYVYDELMNEAEAYAEDGNQRKAKKYREKANHLEVTFKEETSIILNDTYIKSDSELIPCTVVKFSDDEKLDVAIIQMNSKKTPETVKKIVDLNDIAHQEDMELGDKIYTIGFPKGFTLGETDEGIEANNQSGEITQERGEYTYGHNIQIDHGASGSAVFDCHGRFAGIIVSGFFSNGVATGYNQAVLSQKAAEFAK